MIIGKLEAIRDHLGALNEPTHEIDSAIVEVVADVKTLEDQVAKISALEATAKTVADTDLAHKETAGKLSEAHQKSADLEHQLVRCRSAGADLQRQVDELTHRNANLEQAAELAKA